MRVLTSVSLYFGSFFPTQFLQCSCWPTHKWNRSHNLPWCHTLSERVDRITCRQVGAGDKVLTRGCLNLHPRPTLQVAAETVHLTSGEGDVSHTALAAVPWRTTTKAVTCRQEHKQQSLTSSCAHAHTCAFTISLFSPQTYTQMSGQSKCVSNDIYV